ncbi:MAG: hypothetical protein RMJ28_06850 [Nitrososphaerota archaeon]|nr:hypothetical protein [Candidatus Calditenuaceae archaeon]MDW8073931.1 hypothetical protein [Nitrososphaerota archaeon]
MAGYAIILSRATALALILALPPILGLLYLWTAKLHGPLEIVLWIVLSLLWNMLVLALVVRRILFTDRGC